MADDPKAQRWQQEQGQADVGWGDLGQIRRALAALEDLPDSSYVTLTGLTQDATYVGRLTFGGRGRIYAQSTVDGSVRNSKIGGR